MRFSVISTDYDMHVPRHEVQRGIDSIHSQTFQDFEWIIVHDGPKRIPYSEEYDLSHLRKKPIVVETCERMGSAGTYGRDYIMKNLAVGDFFVQFNINNILYPNALELIDINLRNSDCKIAIFNIFHHGLNRHLSGIPEPCRIDLLQLVAHRSIWRDVGYFFDKGPQADGVVYEKMCRLNTWVQISEKLGENF